MVKKSKRLVGGGAATLGAGIWALYSTFATLRNIPDDAKWFAKFLADPPIYTPWLLFLLSLMFVIWTVWPRDESDLGPGENQISQSTTGVNSPNIGNNMGTVNYNINTPSPPLTQERKQAVWHPAGLATYVSKPTPDLPLNGLLVRVYASLGGAPRNAKDKKAFYKRVDEEIADKISLEEAQVWGRYAKRPIEPLSLQTWRRGMFSHRDKTLCVQGDAVHPFCYEDLRFNKKQINAIWPEPPPKIGRPTLGGTN